MTLLHDSQDQTRPFEAMFLLALVSLCWAGSYILIKLAVSEFPPATMAATRLTIAAVLLAFWLQLTGAPLPRNRRVWFRYLGIAFFGQALPFYLIAWAAPLVTTGEMALVIATCPFFAVVFSEFLGRQHLRRKLWLGPVLGFLGLFGFMDITANADTESVWLARAVLVLVAASFAASGRLVETLPSVRASVASTGVTAIAALFLWPISLFFDQPWLLSPSREALGAVVVLGVVSTAFTYVAYYQLIKVSGNAFASLHHYLVPVLALMLGSIVFGEYFGIPHLFFTAVIFIGVGLSRQRARIG